VAPGAHTVITDSGLGGLAVCAALERALRPSAAATPVRLTYVNAWPFEGRGYNDLADVPARARVFDAALRQMAGLRPDRIVIACNTLSILYPHTAFSLSSGVPVRGIIDAGVGVFGESLAEDAAATIVLAGTRTTIESGVHRDRLAARGTDPARIAAVPCHGLAAAIERDVNGPSAARLIEECAARAAAAAPPGGTLLLGLCCTHYVYVAGRLEAALAAKTGRLVRALDPGRRLVEALLAEQTDGSDRSDGLIAAEAGGSRGREAGGEDGAPGGGSAGLADRSGPAGIGAPDGVAVRVMSKVELAEESRVAIARLVEPVSRATAEALLSYARLR